VFDVIIPRDSTAEVQVIVTSTEEVALPETFLTMRELKEQPAALRLTDVIYAVESGAKVFLWWDDDAGDTLILPLEGRGRLDLSPFGGIPNPRKEGFTGHVQVSSSGLGAFILCLEFAKLKD
jgi:hypothetical protein